ncbi:Di-copper centre-containing protein [Pleomassaria siparia CBS 279.74]|uniref:Di-copper centre-containing protein n=1 Tax=Pleomassaria siparia CBS 279.74 TaxID=1314801 RepID=A0A6G1K7W6_9PLEO|nr:Di-copper centre-containing protein [Pleomassaria siparia CBS 279.74]
MRFASHVVLCVVASTLSTALPAPQEEPSPTVTLADGATTTLPTAASTDIAVAIDQLEQLANFAQDEVNASLEDTTTGKRMQKRGTCNRKTLAVRREWGSLSPKERKAYTTAVLCLQSKQAKTPTSLVPGVRSRFDDWVSTHINQTMTIHYTGTFLAWHRYFTWHYEQALRNECGYTGYQPYWDWAKTAQTGLEKSPILDGSDTSMSGNGEFIPDAGNIVVGGDGLSEISFPAGSGGGCVTSGPFKNMTVNLGPVSESVPGGGTISNGDGLSYNPRCLKRDLTDFVNQRFANATGVVDLIVKPQDVETFQMTMQGVPGTGELGVHGGGHYSMGGDPGRDFFVSPGDPLFYLHHGAIDRTWWIWQTLDKKTRSGAEGISGTGTFLNNPASPNTTLDTIIDLGFSAGPAVTVRDLMSTTDGPLCYIYQ